MRSWVVDDELVGPLHQRTQRCAHQTDAGNADRATSRYNKGGNEWTWHCGTDCLQHEPNTAPWRAALMGRHSHVDCRSHHLIKSGRHRIVCHGGHLAAFSLGRLTADSDASRNPHSCPEGDLLFAWTCNNGNVTAQRPVDLHRRRLFSSPFVPCINQNVGNRQLVRPEFINRQSRSIKLIS